MNYTTEELLFFNAMPQILPLYQTLKEKLLAALPETVVRVSKSQISFYCRHLFAMASLPVRKVKGWPKEYLLVSFGLSYHNESARIAFATQPYPGRWTHHVIIQQQAEIDAQLIDLIKEAYEFSMIK